MEGKKNSGFSLVELLVVISIIAVLSAVLMVNFVGMRERSKDAQRIQDLNAIKSALRLYYNDNQSYPASKSVITGSGFANYLPGIGNTNFVYNVGSSGESFSIGITLDAGAGDDDINSQKMCGINPTPIDKQYYVCGN